MLLGWGLAACHSGIDAGEPQAGTTDLGVDRVRLDFLTMVQGGAACFGDCEWSYGLRSPATLVLKDAEGELEFAIAPEEFDQIEQLASTAEFQRVVEDSLAKRACFGFDIGLTMNFQWRGTAAVGPVVVDSCGVEEGNPFAALRSHLLRLLQSHLACPPWEEPPGFQLATDPLPQRALCWFCYGRCLPE